MLILTNLRFVAVLVIIVRSYNNKPMAIFRNYSMCIFNAYYFMNIFNTVLLFFFLRREFNSNKESVEKKLVDLVLEVHIVAPEVRK